MKYFVFLISVWLMASLAAPAHAQSRFTNLLDATERDYETIKSGMQDAREGEPGMTPRELKTAAIRITARRQAIADMRRIGLKVLPREQRGLFRLLVRNLDQANLALLALIGDDKGYYSALRSRDGENWEEGIGLMIDETRRCLYMAKKVSGPFMMQARLAPLQAH